MINLTLDEDHIIQDVYFTGGGNGSLQEKNKQEIGQKGADVNSKLEGIRCGFKNTSCPDQLSKALRQAIGA